MTTELDALDSNPTDTFTLSNGTTVRLLDLKARQFFKLLRIVTHGPGIQLLAQSGSLLSGETPEEAVQRLLGFLIVSIPDAYDETIAFLSDMVQPADLGVGKAANESNKAKWEQLNEVMVNPELEDLVDLISAIITRESQDLAALGKKVVSLFKVAEKTGQLNQSSTQTSQAQNSSEGSVEPTTSSVPSTDGLTNE